MNKVVLLVIVCIFLLSSILVRADASGNASQKSRNSLFVLEKKDYRADLYPYLFCLLTLGSDKETRNAFILSERCKNPMLQYLIMTEQNPTDQIIYTTLRGYDPITQKLMSCIVESGAPIYRSTANQVIEYCDKVIQPLD